MGQKTVLIVDDSRLARMMTQKIIHQAFPQWEIVTANSADEGVSLAAKTPIALALLDYNMPGMNGLDMAVILIEKYPDMVINLVTANIQDKMRERAEAIGVGFIPKPVSEKKLSKIFTKLE
jgi:two-component system, chemotaxis family, chemotaxis protein CheY